MFVDAIYESLRRELSAQEAVLCAWGICEDGRKVLLHMALGTKESYSAPDCYDGYSERAHTGPLAPGRVAVRCTDRTARRG